MKTVRTILMREYPSAPNLWVENIDCRVPVKGITDPDAMRVLHVYRRCGHRHKDGSRAAVLCHLRMFRRDMQRRGLR